MDKQAKNRTRRVIRVLMVFIAAVLLVVALGIPVANNFIAHGVKIDLEALPLPPDTRVVESLSVAGKANGNGNGMQYFAALLLQSDRTRDELQAHYTALAGETDSLFLTYRVESQTGQTVAPIEIGTYRFTHPVEGAGYYILYTQRGSYGGLLDLDMRGH